METEGACPSSRRDPIVISRIAKGLQADFKVEVTDSTSDLWLAMYGFTYLDWDAIGYLDGILSQTGMVYLKLSDLAQSARINRWLVQLRRHNGQRITSSLEPLR